MYEKTFLCPEGFFCSDKKHCKVKYCDAHKTMEDNRQNKNNRWFSSSGGVFPDVHAVLESIEEYWLGKKVDLSTYFLLKNRLLCHL